MPIKMKNFSGMVSVCLEVMSNGLKFSTTYKTRHRQSDKIRLFDFKRVTLRALPISLIARGNECQRCRKPLPENA
jgi:hypothetical protein